jgi:hypothetical protein
VARALRSAVDLLAAAIVQRRHYYSGAARISATR